MGTNKPKQFEEVKEIRHYHSTEDMPYLHKKTINFEGAADRIIRVQLDPHLLNATLTK